MSTEQLLVVIPFAGFFESIFSSEIDYLSTNHCEYYTGDEVEEENRVMLSPQDYADILWRCEDYSVAHEYIAEQYADYFNDFLTEKSGIDFGLKFESMTSPREYNFTTNRIFCHISVENAQKMLDEITPLTMIEAIERNFTSRDGFTSSYSNDYDDWKDKPIEEYDHNELMTVLEAFMTSIGDCENYEDDIFSNMQSSNVFDTAYDKCVNWSRLDVMVADAIIENKEDENGNDV